MTTQKYLRADATPGEPMTGAGSNLDKKSHYFPNANKVTGTVPSSQQIISVSPQRLDESQWPGLLDRKLQAMIRRFQEMPTLDQFEAVVLKSAGFSKMPRESKVKLRLAIKKAHKQYRSLEIAGAFNADIDAKSRDAYTNAVSRRYVNGTF